VTRVVMEATSAYVRREGSAYVRREGA